MRGDVLAVVGAQYGSEGKGVIVNKIADRFDVHVRVGGPNAGHSFYHQNKLYKMQMLPCGWVNPNAILVIGAGAIVSLDQLQKEVEEIEAAGFTIKSRLIIDGGAFVLDDRHHHAEGGVDGEIHRRIGSTGEGVGSARVARMNRDENTISRVCDVAWKHGLNKSVGDSVTFLNEQNREGKSILLEGTQGSALSLIHGPWPYVTSADTNAGQLLVDVGLPPTSLTDTMLVARTFPIRVAGNSGPLKGEMNWEEMSQMLGKPVLERTTVTKKVRRIGMWDSELFVKAVMLNDPTEIALTFIDYVNPADEGKTRWNDLSAEARDFVYRVERLAPDASVCYIGTGGPQWEVIERT